MATGKKTDSKLIDEKLGALGDWRGETLARVRKLIKQAVPDVVEEIKWRKPSNPGGVPVWSSNGILCTGEALKDKVKLTFMHGAALDDPDKVFNAGFGGNSRRAIDLKQGDKLNDKAFKTLVKAAARHNTSK